MLNPISEDVDLFTYLQLQKILNNTYLFLDKVDKIEPTHIMAL